MSTQTIETTLGAIPADQLGRVNAHDHVILDGGLTVIKEPDFKLDSVEKSSEEIARWKQADGGAIVDTMPFGCGRNVDKLIAVSKNTGVPMIIPTGFQKITYYLADHWQHRYNEDEIAQLLIAEIREGVDANNYDGPIIARRPQKAGFVKVAGEYQFIPPTVQKLIRAAGKTHQATGAPILVHTEHGTAGDELLDALEAAGVPPQHVMLCHVDRNPDLNVHKRWAQRGAFLEYDTPGRIKYAAESTVIALMRGVIDAGYGHRLLLGGDMARRSYWKAYGGGPGFDYLLTQFTPRLAAEGFSTAELDLIWRKNPVTWLLGATPQVS